MHISGVTRQETATERQERGALGQRIAKARSGFNRCERLAQRVSAEIERIGGCQYCAGVQRVRFCPTGQRGACPAQWFERLTRQPGGDQSSSLLKQRFRLIGRERYGRIVFGTHFFDQCVQSFEMTVIEASPVKRLPETIVPAAEPLVSQHTSGYFEITNTSLALFGR
jgi:hypothetical protein